MQRYSFISFCILSSILWESQNWANHQTPVTTWMITGLGWNNLSLCILQTSENQVHIVDIWMYIHANEEKSGSEGKLWGTISKLMAQNTPMDRSCLPKFRE